jgi:hypothetical protein
MSVTEEQIKKNPRLKFSQRFDDTGVILSWNATAPSEVKSGAYKKFITWKQGALVTNPITWKTHEMPVPASQNKASRVIGPDNISFEMVKNYAGAAVDFEKGVLITIDVDESLYPSLSASIGKYHRHDIAFYYNSIRQNIKDRIFAFKETSAQ